MKQDLPTTRFARACFLAALLLLVGTGWGPALSRMLGSRPTWSVCGQAMCSCLPLETVCPLCPQDATPGSCLGDDPKPIDPQIDPSRIALMPNGPNIILGLASATDGLLIGLFLIGSGHHAEWSESAARASVPGADWVLPNGPAPDPRTPPPRRRA